MELLYLEEQMRQLLSEGRFTHSQGVVEVCHDLALIYGCDTNKACIAGILHDCAKQFTKEELLEECHKNQVLISEVEQQNPDLLHAKVGMILARKCYGIVDEDILNAISYHTTGRPGMSLLEKIVFTADYIEPNRKPLPRIEEIRKAAYEINLEKAILLIIENTLSYLKSTGAIIDFMTVKTYECYKTEV